MLFPGDGPIYYEVLSSVRASVQVKHWPNTQAVAQILAQNPAMEQILLTHTITCVQPVSPTLRGSFGMMFYLQ